MISETFELSSDMLDCYIFIRKYNCSFPVKYASEMGSVDTGLVATPPRDVLSRRYRSNKQTCILTLTFPDLFKAGDLLQKMQPGIHCWELRYDLLSPIGEPQESSVPPADYVEKQIQYLRSHSNLPILFSLRTKSQGGRFPDNESQAAVELLSLAIDLACDYVECDNNLPLETINELVRRASGTKIVGVHHLLSGDMKWTSPVVEDIYKRIDQYAGECQLLVSTTSVLTLTLQTLSP
jgi:pentafunctional AROM polypeptide